MLVNKPLGYPNNNNNNCVFILLQTIILKKFSINLKNMTITLTKHQ